MVITDQSAGGRHASDVPTLPRSWRCDRGPKTTGASRPRAWMASRLSRQWHGVPWRRPCSSTGTPRPGVGSTVRHPAHASDARGAFPPSPIGPSRACSQRRWSRHGQRGSNPRAMAFARDVAPGLRAARVPVHLVYADDRTRGSQSSRRWIMLISVGWVPPYLCPSGAGLARGTRVSCRRLTPPRIAPNRGCLSSDRRSVPLIR